MVCFNWNTDLLLHVHVSLVIDSEWLELIICHLHNVYFFIAVRLKQDVTDALISMAKQAGNVDPDVSLAVVLEWV